MKDMAEVYLFCLVVVAGAGMLYYFILDQVKTIRRHRALNSGALVVFTIDGRTHNGVALRTNMNLVCIRESGSGLLRYIHTKNVTIL